MSQHGFLTALALHAQICWRPSMQEVCAETIADARRWVRSEDVDARGMTDILAPLKLALAMLEGVQGARANLLADHCLLTNAVRTSSRADQQSNHAITALLASRHSFRRLTPKRIICTYGHEAAGLMSAAADYLSM